MTSIIKTPSKYVWKNTSNAEAVWKGLNGIFTVFKASGLSMGSMSMQLKLHICTDLNELKTRPPIPYIRIDGETNKELTINVGESFADHELLVGPRYQPEDIRIFTPNNLSKFMSGVALVGINRGTSIARHICDSKPINCYKVKGKLGTATDNALITGRIVEKSTWKHTRRHHIDAICASLQSSHQKTMFEVCGVNIQSQAAYDLASQGLLRPTQKEIPMIYSIKCVAFEPPEFTLEIVSIHTKESDIATLVNNIGLLVRSNATCTQIQCYRYGIFTTENALLKRDWHLQNIINNLKVTYRQIRMNKEFINPKNPIFREYLGNTFRSDSDDKEVINENKIDVH